MFGDFLRSNKVVAAVLVVLRVVLGWAWLSSGWGKVTGEFNAAGYLQNAVANPVMNGEVMKYPWYVSFLEGFAIPNAEIFSFVVAWGEVLVGLGLIVGVFTSAAAFFGMVMNMSFLLAGTISSNPWMVAVSVIIMVAGANAGRYGGDRYVLPYLKEKLNLNKRSFKWENQKQAVHESA
ncbi:DoxX family protein [Alkalihalobacillus pseudalcaliphilus]|uniref:DoxX family protein n=1 Tax=Alkalihalobacillus pseudalcaliphilus TaxID=79884 RepID=UPI00064E1029|nr:DoxX family protein [Alkalihalobacillus pseudalcaliphilus]KMK74375.1 Crp/Fnr family transcriptional regulator [Alkalihalobacillus pseudalcaliphilus]